MLKKYRLLYCLFFMLLLAGCSSRNHLAPVSEIQWRPFASFQTTHVVRRGETLYAIAFGYDTDFRQLARINRLRPPYSLRVGQVLSLRGISRQKRRSLWVKAPSRARQVRPVVSQPKSRTIFSAFLGKRSSSGWLWPANGRVASTFIPEQGKKGINIACKKGEKVHAASGGVVAYAGSGLRGYGNLIIIKHNNEYLTAYGNNARNLVSEGQQVKPGQVIAQVGVMDRRYWGVHFEIRKRGVPVNPLNYLQKG